MPKKFEPKSHRLSDRDNRLYRALNKNAFELPKIKVKSLE